MVRAQLASHGATSLRWRPQKKKEEEKEKLHIAPVERKFTSSQAARHGASRVSALPLPDVRAGDHVVRPHVLPEVRRGLPAVQVPRVQGEVETARGESHEEQRPAHRRGGEVLPGRGQDEVPNTGEAQAQQLRGGFAHRQRGTGTMWD